MSLDEAWAEAEDALGKRWEVSLHGNHDTGWYATAEAWWFAGGGYREVTTDTSRWGESYRGQPTPAAALHALAAKLREAKS